MIQFYSKKKIISKIKLFKKNYPFILILELYSDRVLYLVVNIAAAFSLFSEIMTDEHDGDSSVNQEQATVEKSGLSNLQESETTNLQEKAEKKPEIVDEKSENLKNDPKSDLAENKKTEEGEKTESTNETEPEISEKTVENTSKTPNQDTKTENPTPAAEETMQEAELVTEVAKDKKGAITEPLKTEETEPQPQDSTDKNPESLENSKIETTVEDSAPQSIAEETSLTPEEPISEKPKNLDSDDSDDCMQDTLNVINAPTVNLLSEDEDMKDVSQTALPDGDTEAKAGSELAEGPEGQTGDQKNKDGDDDAMNDDAKSDHQPDQQILTEQELRDRIYKNYSQNLQNLEAADDEFENFSISDFENQIENQLEDFEILKLRCEHLNLTVKPTEMTNYTIKDIINVNNDEGTEELGVEKILPREDLNQLDISLVRADFSLLTTQSPARTSHEKAKNSKNLENLSSSKIGKNKRIIDSSDEENSDTESSRSEAKKMKLSEDLPKIDPSAVADPKLAEQLKIMEAERNKYLEEKRKMEEERIKLAKEREKFKLQQKELELSKKQDLEDRKELERLARQKRLEEKARLREEKERLAREHRERRQEEQARERLREVKEREERRNRERRERERDRGKKVPKKVAKKFKSSEAKDYKYYVRAKNF